ncbi:hypothetical protein BDV93DRAFT_522588 [Ceratobasidium sp. AG-I]|nr:hypothetical protein BDV93DRAFT_522588 [Ceratobasidium sp. AG-I]
MHSTFQQCSIHIHDVAGPVTLNFNDLSSRSPPPLPLLNAGSCCSTFAIIIISIPILYLLYTILPGLRDHLSPVGHVHRVVSSGRSPAVSLGGQAKTTSPIEERAVSLDDTTTSENAPPLQNTPPPIEPTAQPHQALSRVYTKSNPLPGVDLLGGTSASPLVNCYSRCASRRRGCGVAQNRGSVVQPETSCCPPCSSALHGSTNHSSPSRSVKSVSRSDVKVPSAPEPPSHLASDARSPLMGGLAGLGPIYAVTAFCFLAIELDWSHDADAPLPGVKDDLKWLKWLFSDFNPAVALHTLTNPAEATLANIRSKILEMFREACLGTVVVIHLNGHGDGGSFLLYNLDRINATLLIEWIQEIRVETNRHLTVCILFDHCQSDSFIPPPHIQPGENIHFLWACLPGQRSADFKMAGDDEAKIPRSNLLKALCLLADDIRTRPAGSVDCFMFRITAWMNRVVRIMRAEECRMRWCWRPCVTCSCPSYDDCSHPLTRARHPIAQAYPRDQNPDGIFCGHEACVCVYQLLFLIEPAANPFLDRMQETARGIKAHKAYRMLNTDGSYTWLTVFSILVSMLLFILASIRLCFARLIALRQPVPATGSIPSPAGLPGEDNLFRPDNSSTQRGREVNTAVGLVPPLPV